MLRCLLFAGLSVSPALAEPAFRDDFAALSPDHWYISDGWRNGPQQNCTWTADGVTVADGILRLAFLPGDSADDHRCAEVQTRATFGYGTFEARLRTGTGSGLNAAFFTYIGPVHDAPHDEIDVEILTRDPSRVSLNTFVDGQPWNGTVVPVDPPASAAFHTYAFVWTPQDIRWFIDGRQVHRATAPLPVTPQKIYLSHWGSDTLTDWMGPFVTPPGPVVMEVDWVAFTPLGAPCRFAGSIACEAR